MTITAEDVARRAAWSGWETDAALVRSLERIRVAAEAAATFPETQLPFLIEALDAHRKEFGS